MRPEDLIPIYRRRTTIDPSGKETVIQAKYFVVDSVEALSKFGTDAWERVVCVMTTGQAWQFRPYKWNEPRQLFHNGIFFCLTEYPATLKDLTRLFIVKGIYVSWSNDPPNMKIKDWNVTELKVSCSYLLSLFCQLVFFFSLHPRLILIDVTLINQLWLIFGRSWIRGYK